VAGASKISPTLAREIKPDIAFISYLVGLLQNILARLSPLSGAGFDGVTQSAAQYFLWLKSSWETTQSKNLPLDKVKEVDDAEAFAVNFLAPLLEAEDFATALTDPAVFGTQALLSARTSSVSLQPSTPLTAASFTGSPIPNFLLVYAGGFVEIRDLLLTKGLPLDATESATSCIMGTILLSSFPLWMLYHELHGYATFARIQTRLQASIAACPETLNATLQNVLASAPPIMPSDGIDSVYIVSSIMNVLNAALRKKIEEYIPAFSNECQAINAARVRLQSNDLMAALKSQAFWKQTQGQKTTLNFGQVPAGLPANAILPYIGQVSYAANELVQKRSFWAPQSTWDTVIKACQLICQSGFQVFITAVDNPNAGRHPPHLTHRNGVEVDFIWSYTTTSGNVPNLSQSKLTYGDGPFFDVATNRFFNVAPLSGGHMESVSQFGLAQLATIAALQAVALAGIKRYLYLDFVNMLNAGVNLGLAIDPNLNPYNGGRGTIPVVEGMGHFNHLHIEVPGPHEKAADFLTSKVLTIMYYLAMLRDKNEDFLNSVFRPPNSVKKIASQAEEKQADDFKTQWTTASTNMSPYLLPVWVPEDIKKKLKTEKIEVVLGIDG
jgi:hypothetical protein